MALCLEYPCRKSLGERRAEVARFGKAIRSNRLGREDRFGRLRVRADDQRLGDGPEAPAGCDAVDGALDALSGLT